MHVGELLPARALCAAATVAVFGAMGLSPCLEATTTSHAESRLVHLDVALTAANPVNNWYGFLADVADTIGPGYDLLNGAATLAGIVLTPVSWIALPITITAGLLIANAAFAANPLAVGGGIGAFVSAALAFAGIAFFAPVVITNGLLPPREFLRDFRDAPTGQPPFVCDTPQADEPLGAPSAAAVDAIPARVAASTVRRGLEALPGESAAAEVPGGSASTEPEAVRSVTTDPTAVESATSDPEAVEPVRDSSPPARRPVLQPTLVSAASADTTSSAAKPDYTRRASRNAPRPTP